LISDTKTPAPLLGIPSPRDIPEFSDCITKLGQRYPIYIAKYMKAPQAYTAIRDFFLSQSDFDPLVTFADDLIVTEDDLEHLLDISKKYPDAVISGICNFDMWNHKEQFCFSVKKFPGVYPYGYDLPEFFRKHYVELVDEYLVPVSFNAFACVIIPRHIVEKVPFRHDKNGSGVDVNFCQDCIKSNIDMYADIRVNMTHLGGRMNGHLEKWGVGIKEPNTQFFLTCNSTSGLTKLIF
jgi:hypothetical protein